MFKIKESTVCTSRMYTYAKTNSSSKNRGALCKVNFYPLTAGYFCNRHHCTPVLSAHGVDFISTVGPKAT